MNVYTCKFRSCFGYCGGLIVVAANSEEDAKSKRAVVVAAEKARDATTYIGSQLSDSQQVRLAMAAIKKVFNELKYNDNESK